jgi:hypothetical protein
VFTFKRGVQRLSLTMWQDACPRMDMHVSRCPNATSPKLYVLNDKFTSLVVRERDKG